MFKSWANCSCWGMVMSLIGTYTLVFRFTFWDSHNTQTILLTFSQKLYHHSIPEFMWILMFRTCLCLSISLEGWSGAIARVSWLPTGHGAANATSLWRCWTEEGHLNVVTVVEFQGVPKFQIFGCWYWNVWVLDYLDYICLVCLFVAAPVSRGHVWLTDDGFQAL